jgi:hypothetical protein
MLRPLGMHHVQVTGFLNSNILNLFKYFEFDYWETGNACLCESVHKNSRENTRSEQ